MATKTFGGSDVDFGDSQFLFGGGEVAVIWWKSFVNTTWSNNGNYATTEGSGATDANQPTSSDSLYLSDEATPNNLTLDADEVALNVYTDNADTGGTDAWTGILDLATYNLVLAGEIKMVSGSTLKIGTSAGTGLTTVGLNLPAGSTFDLEAASVINNSSDLTVHNSSIWTTSARGYYTQTDDGNYNNINTQNTFARFTINADKKLTITGNGSILAGGPSRINLNGTIDVNGNLLKMGFISSGGVLTFALGCDIVGAGQIRFTMIDSATYTNSKIGAFGFTGTVEIQGFAGDVRNAITGDWSNANYEIITFGAAPNDIKATAGILKCKNFNITNNNLAVTVDNSNNPTYEISEALDISDGTAVTTWTGGAFKLTGSNANVNFRGQMIGTLELACTAGQAKSVVTNFNAASLSGTSGILKSTVNDTQRTITTAATGVATDCTFQDISCGSANQVNAKSVANPNTNNGNNLGIVFEDSFGDM